MSDLINEAKELMKWTEYREPTMLEFLRYYKRGVIAEIHIEAVIGGSISEPRRLLRAEAEIGELRRLWIENEGAVIKLSIRVKELESRRKWWKR